MVYYSLVSFIDRQINRAKQQSLRLQRTGLITKFGLGGNFPRGFQKNRLNIFLRYQTAYSKVQRIFVVQQKTEPQRRSLSDRSTVDYAYNERGLQKTSVYNEPISSYFFEKY